MRNKKNYVGSKFAVLDFDVSGEVACSLSSSVINLSQMSALHLSSRTCLGILESFRATKKEKEPFSLLSNTDTSGRELSIGLT